MFCPRELVHLAGLLHLACLSGSFLGFSSSCRGRTRPGTRGACCLLAGVPSAHPPALLHIHLYVCVSSVGISHDWMCSRQVTDSDLALAV